MDLSAAADRTQRYKGIVPEILSDRSLASLRLCELFFFRAKKLWSARYDFPPRRTGAKKDKALKNFLHWENVIFYSRVG